MAVITISRQYGSGGNEIATHLCKTLGYRYFDKNLMALVALEAGLSESEIVDFSEENYKVRTFFERLLGVRRDRQMITDLGHLAEEGIGLKTREVTELDELKSIHMVRDTIIHAYKLNNVVIVGRGGQIILRNKPGVLRVRVIAPLRVRVEWLRAQQRIDQESAEAMILKRDQAAADYLKRFHHIDWNEPELYDLVLNTEHIELDDAAQLVIKALVSLKT